MRHAVLIAACLLAFALPAGAHTLSLNVGDCVAGGGQPHAVSFACNTNSATVMTLVGTVNLTADVPDFNAASATLEITSDQSALPDWWHFDTGCRAGYASTTWNVAAGDSCHSLWDAWFAASGNNPITVGKWQMVEGSANRLRYTGSAAIGTANMQPMTDSTLSVTEWGVLALTIPANKTTGLGACSGCSYGACITLAEVDLNLVSNPTPIAITDAGSGSNSVAYNGCSGSCPRCRGPGTGVYFCRIEAGGKPTRREIVVLK